MSTITAQILVGKEHQNHGGIIPSHVLYLTENSRPTWILLPHDIFSGLKGTKINKVVWIPTVDKMLEDALLMIGLIVLKDEQLLKIAEEIFHDAYYTIDKPLMLYNYDLDSLYERCRAIKTDCKLVITVLDGSTIKSQLKILEKYNNFYTEVCITSYYRRYSVWNESVVTGGNL